MYLTPFSETIRAELESGILGLLITPESHRPEQYDVRDFVAWAADNGCFTRGESFSEIAWLDWLDSFPLESREWCLFATAPDVVGDWDATLERSLPLLETIRELGYRAAIVLQDGATIDTIPWDEIDVVFVGGSTEWKLGEIAAECVAEARRRGKMSHVGRVNSIKRGRICREMKADHADGTLLIFGPEANRSRVLRTSWAIGLNWAHPTEHACHMGA